MWSWPFMTLILSKAQFVLVINWCEGKRKSKIKNFNDFIRRKSIDCARAWENTSNIHDIEKSFTSNALNGSLTSKANTFYLWINSWRSQSSLASLFSFFLYGRRNITFKIYANIKTPKNHQQSIIVKKLLIYST